jgi:hypothetical protein
VVGSVAHWCGAEGVTCVDGGSVSSSAGGRGERALSPHRRVSVVIWLYLSFHIPWITKKIATDSVNSCYLQA